MPRALVGVCLIVLGLNFEALRSKFGTAHRPYLEARLRYVANPLHLARILISQRQERIGGPPSERAVIPYVVPTVLAPQGNIVSDRFGRFPRAGIRQ